MWRTLRMYSRNSSRSISFTMRSYALPCRETTSRMAAAAFLRAASLACLDTGACLAAAFLSAFAAFLLAAFAAFLDLPAMTGWAVERDAWGGGNRGAKVSRAKVGMRLFRNERIRGAGSRGEVRGRSVRTLAGRARVRPAGDAHCVATRALEANMARELTVSGAPWMCRHVARSRNVCSRILFSGRFPCLTS